MEKLFSHQRREFRVYGDVLDQVEASKHRWRMLSKDKNDAGLVVGQLVKELSVWGELGEYCVAMARTPPPIQQLCG